MKKEATNKNFNQQLEGLVKKGKLKDTDTDGILSYDNKKYLKGIYKPGVEEKEANLIPADYYKGEYTEEATEQEIAEVKEQTLDEKIRGKKRVMEIVLVLFLMSLVICAYNLYGNLNG